MYSRFRFSIVFLLILLYPLEGFSQLEFQKRLSSNKENSQLPPNFHYSQKNEKSFNKGRKILAVVILGIAGGFVFGGGLGILLPEPQGSQDELIRILRGVQIGLMVFPVYCYERILVDADNKNKWAIGIGVNTTHADHAKWRAIPEYTLIANRTYFMTSNWNFNVAFQYSMRKFQLAESKIQFYNYTDYESSSSNGIYDINFTEGYFDVSLMPEYNFRKRDTIIGLSFGASLAVPIYDNMGISLVERQNLENNERNFYYYYDEPAGPIGYFSAAYAITLRKQHYFVQLLAKRSLHYTNEIFFLTDESTRLSSFDLNLGIVF
ncbi:MAG: hypothetical protein H6696_06640 [Deferribacteres bacterium]|nr:hypothetical protein [candidate division KSB1 bacterium]MCB9501598.1 hypothetical protein [Deferribacteres bacterium]